MPNGEQQHAMRRFAGSCRYVFNRGLALQKERYANGEKRLSYAGLCKAPLDYAIIFKALRDRMGAHFYVFPLYY